MLTRTRDKIQETLASVEQAGLDQGDQAETKMVRHVKKGLRDMITDIYIYKGCSIGCTENPFPKISINIM